MSKRNIPPVSGLCMPQTKFVPEKSKTNGVLLAIFFGPLSWIYTYKYDAVKFWIGLLCGVVLCWTLVVPLLIWLIAVLDMAFKDDRLYTDYYK